MSELSGVTREATATRSVGAPAGATGAAGGLGGDLGSAAMDRLAALAVRTLNATGGQVTLLGARPTVVGAAGLAAVSHIGQEVAGRLCVVAAELGTAVVVRDGTADERVRALPPTSRRSVGSYLGVPLTGPREQSLGTLCVFDARPRAWSDADVGMLRQLGEFAVAELELAKVAVEHESSRVRWELAIDAAGVGNFDWDLRTGVLTWDERLRDMFGYEGDTFDRTIEAFYARLHPDDVAQAAAAVQQALDTCGDFSAEYRVVHPGGETRWVLARGKVLPDEAGSAVRLLGAAFDRTWMRTDDAHVARVLESMSAGFFSVDHDWRFTYVNTEAERLLGRPRQELLGAALWSLFPEASVGILRDAVSSHDQHAFEAYYPPLDAWFEVRVWPGPDGLSVYFLDVTESRLARDASEHAARSLALLADVTAALSETLDPVTAVARLARLVVPQLADWCIVSLVDEEGGLSDVGCWHGDEEARSLVETYANLRLDALMGDALLRQSLRSGEVVLLPENALVTIQSMLEPGQARTILGKLAPESAAVLPLRARGRTVGLLTLFRGPQRPPMDPADLATAEDTALRAGLALDNARLYAQQWRMAESLQRSLLTRPPEPDHLQIVVRYQPAAEAARVGGDWYDAFLQSDGGTVMVIGDVVGHDTAAAAAMGQLRGLLRGIAFHSGAGPADVLAGLDAAMQGLQVDTTATAVVARLEQTGREEADGVTRVRWSNAGHPPPMVVDPHGAVVALQADEADLLLGLDPSTTRVESRVVLERGATLLLYTDGLVERRGQSLDDGLASLRAVLQELSDRSLDEVCDGVLRRLLPPDADDDVALVAVRLHRQDRPRPAEAGPRDVPPEVPPESSAF